MKLVVPFFPPGCSSYFSIWSGWTGMWMRNHMPYVQYYEKTCCISINIWWIHPVGYPLLAKRDNTGERRESGSKCQLPMENNMQCNPPSYPLGKESCLIALNDEHTPNCPTACVSRLLGFWFSRFGGFQNLRILREMSTPSFPRTAFLMMRVIR